MLPSQRGIADKSTVQATNEHAIRAHTFRFALQSQQAQASYAVAVKAVLVPRSVLVLIQATRSRQIEAVIPAAWKTVHAHAVAMDNADIFMDAGRVLKELGKQRYGSNSASTSCLAGWTC